MNKIERGPTSDGLAEDRRRRLTAKPTCPRTGERRAQRAPILMIGVSLLLIAALGVGFWRHYSLNAEVMATAEARREFVPSVRTALVRASGSTMSVTWPGTTEAFEQANIYARASGYISKRNVDIGSRVKAGELLIEITAPELDHQIAKAEGTLAQMQASLANRPWPTGTSPRSPGTATTRWCKKAG